MEELPEAVHVRKYRNTADAAENLDIISGSSSPLLGLIKFVGENTFMPPTKSSGPWLIENAINKAGLGRAKQKAANAEKTAEKLEGYRPEFTWADVSRVFQPAHQTVSPESGNLVTDKNKPYVDNLRLLQQNLAKYANSSDSERPSLILPAQDAFSQANNAEKSLADGFHKDTEGIDDRVSELLLQPIRNAKSLIPANPDIEIAKKKVGELVALCRGIQPTLSKYPFNPRGVADASLPEISSVFAPNSGLIWKYEQESLGELMIKNGPRWEQRPEAPKPRVSPEMLEFLNRAQQLTDVFFPAGAQQPRLQYVLRPTKQDIGVKLVIDGATMNSKESSIQKTFDWPAQPGVDPGASGVVIGTFESGFGKHSGLWGVFKLFQKADDRPLGAREVTWSKVQGVGGEVQPLSPPVKVEFVQFPGGVDLFNPRFFEPLKCPSQATGQ